MTDDNINSFLLDLSDNLNEVIASQKSLEDLLCLGDSSSVVNLSNLSFLLGLITFKLDTQIQEVSQFIQNLEQSD